MWIDPLPQIRRHPLGRDGHHTDAPITAADGRLADHLAHEMGTLRLGSGDKSSMDEWAHVVRALRIHGLMIVETPELLRALAANEITA